MFRHFMRAPGTAEPFAMTQREMCFFAQADHVRHPQAAGGSIVRAARSIT
jgi:hypothetical protein